MQHTHTQERSGKAAVQREGAIRLLHISVIGNATTGLYRLVTLLNL